MSGGLKSIKLSADRLKASLGILNKGNSCSVYIYMCVFISSCLQLESVIAKSTPQDLLLFQQETTKKYPGYTPPHLPLKEATPMTINASPSLATALGYSNAIEHVELLYQTLFPPKSLTNTTKNKQQQQQHHLLQNYFPLSPYVSPAFPLPLSHTQGPDVPQSITEAGNVYMANMHVSLSNFQVIQERSKGIHSWQNKHKPAEQNNTIDDEAQTWIERLYAKLLPELQNVIVVLLKLLLTSVSPNKNNSNTSSSDHGDVSEDAVTLEYLEEVDAKRNREVLSKAISGLLLLLLKWSKSSRKL